jgi:uncharacterized membrane protein
MAREAVLWVKSLALAVRVPVGAVTVILAGYAPAALSYVGPGAGLGMIASLFAMVLAVLATIVGLILWPFRLLMRRMKRRNSTEQPKPPTAER